MSPTLQKFEVKFFETIVLSLLLHASLLVIIPRVNLNDVVIPELLNVEIELSKPQPPKIEEIPKPIEPPKKQEKPVEKKQEVKPEIKPIQETVKEEVIEPIIEEIAEPLNEQAIEEAIKPVPEAVPTQASPEVVKQVTDSYTNQLTRAIAKQKKYPKIAQMRQWQGEVLLNVEIDPQGNLVKTEILEASRYKILNNEAVDMVKRAAPFPNPPEELQKRNFTVLVPISFKLE
ncbi:MAG: energy transducer TonB family protein [Methylophilaceae bacterium]